MENLFKKQYEISLWEDTLCWQRRKASLPQIQPTLKGELKYEAGKFYSYNLTSIEEEIIKELNSLEITTFDSNSKVIKYSEIVEFVATFVDGERTYFIYKNENDKGKNEYNTIHEWVAFSTEKLLKAERTTQCILDASSYKPYRFYYELEPIQDNDYEQTTNIDPVDNPDWYDFILTTDTVPNINKIYYWKQASNEKWIKFNGETFEQNVEYYEAFLKPGNVLVQFFKERKICVIGSDSMDTPVRAFNPKLVSNTNGSSTLTFSMFYKYYDMESGQLLDNPFITFMVNERKIKLRHGELDASDCEWYDFVIKNIQENSENKTFSYTAKDLFINELSKSGFDIELDAKLENNQGTIWQLGETILEGSDWQIDDSVEKTVFKQTKEEPLYKIILTQDIEATNMENEEDTISIAAGQEIYGFYTPISEELPYFQFVYVEDKENEFKEDPDKKYEFNEDYVITNSPNYYIDNVTYKDGIPSFAVNKVLEVSNKFRGARLVRKTITEYDNVIDKYVAVYQDSEGNKVYGYVEDEYISPTTVSNYVTNPSDYDALTGWTAGTISVAAKAPALELTTIPDIFKNPQAEEYVSYLNLKLEAPDQVLINSGISDYRSQLNGFAAGKQFIFRYKEKDNKTLKAKVCKYEIKDGIYSILETYLNFNQALEKSEEYTVTYKASCLKSMSYSEMTLSRLGLFIYSENSEEFLIQDVQFFAYETDFNNEMCTPGGTPISGVKKKYYYYYPDSSYETIDDIVFIYEGEIQPTEYVPKYSGDTGYEKIRSITATESNRFNLIQDLCETFECWPKFRIEHDKATGEILYDENYRQKKWVSFHDFIGNKNDVGFRYGINLKAITRTIDSDGIVSKMVVKDNSNEYATDGFCSIARATENPTGENFIFDFRYYINQGLLRFSEVNNDLYSDVSGYIGYYKKLKRINSNREDWILEQSKLLTDESKLEANYQVYETSVQQAEELKEAKRNELISQTSFSYEVMIGDVSAREELLAGKTEEEQAELLQKIEDWKKDDSTKAYCASIAKLTNTISKNTILRGEALTALKQNRARQKELEELLKNLKEEKLTLEIQFYKKYSRFIQEGSWIEENYIDDNLYYLDAESTLHTSSQPKVTYNINVLELSRIPGYESYIFNLGDKTFIEDTEFFGWQLIDGIQTPRHEEIIVNEITIALDSPEQNEIKVQNYKTQFEDLFQRITATTQSIEYSTGQYNKATSIVQTDGTISAITMQNSLANNAFIISNARDQSVVWDETGITTTSLSNPNEIVRIVSGGVFLTDDGGTNWHTGITGKGINANYITTGQLDTSLIRIMAGSFPSFRWDGVGLSAYEFELNEDGKTGKNFNYSKFVRFDQYGLYGINGQANFNPLVAENGLCGEDKIWNKAHFALTWKGFSLKNDNGSVRITSTDDIQVLSDSQERIKIGRLDNGAYGIRISDAEGAQVMVTKDDGTLWLENHLYIGTNNTSTVGIGFLEDVREGTNIHEVFHAGNNEDQQFIIYEDGRMIASGASFTGTIHATGGQIGNMAINNIEQTIEQSQKLDIFSNLGYNFKVEEMAATPSQLELIAKPVGFTLKTNSTSWQGTTDFETWDQLATNSDIYILTYDIFKEIQENNIYYIKANTTSVDGKIYENWVTIMAIFDGEKGKDGAPGEDALTLIITSSGGNYFKNSQGETTLTAKLFKSNMEVDANGSGEYIYSWTKKQEINGETITTNLGNGKQIIVKSDDITVKAVFSCTVTKNGGT